MPRCPVCRARAIVAEASARVCAWCGARWNGPHPPNRAALDALLVPGPVVADPSRTSGLLLDDYTFRSAATARGLRFIPSRGEPITAHSREPAEGVLSPLEPAHPANIALVVLSRGDDPRLPTVLQRHASDFGEAVVVIDGKAPDGQLAGIGRLTLVERPLTRFDRSRNAGQRAASCDWTFHLDTDEVLPGPLRYSLHALTQLADAAGLDAIGFPRDTFVDGVRSDLHPDVQYRLVRSQVLFEGAVHERPDACRDWTRTMVAQTGAIEHRVERAHVLARQARYDAMGQSAERKQDVRALLRPFAA